jgi:uroporphyrinogen-III synthase
VQHVLITRAEPDASETAARIVGRGLQPIVAPIFTHLTLPLSVPSSRHIAAVLLTSRNAIPACPDSLHHKPVYAVGPATARRAGNAGFQHVTNADGDAISLAARVAKEISPTSGSLLVPTAAGQGLTLVSALRDQGFRVLRRVAYRTVKLPSLPSAAVQALAAGHVAFTLIFSTESARHLIDLILASGLGGAVRNITVVAISERPTMALRRLPWRRIVVAARPNQDAMLALLP